jgi:hypothetical protein
VIAEIPVKKEEPIPLFYGFIAGELCAPPAGYPEF